MILTDTHTHLYYETDPAKLALLMERSLDNKVQRLFLPNVDLASVPLVFDLAEQYPNNCFPMLGLHPCDVKENYAEEIEMIFRAGGDRKIYAIGEIGIDLYWDKTTRHLQEEAFRLQIIKAKEADLPIVIHCRDSFDEVAGVLRQMKDEKLRGIFHCFTGNAAQAAQIIELGFFLGIGGVLTYKKSGLAEVLKDIDPAFLVLETDSPYLTPVPFRGKSNESSYLIHIAQKLADIKQMPVDEIARITTRNSQIIFGV
jgi:TatD DNase family protein